MLRKKKLIDLEEENSELKVQLKKLSCEKKDIETLLYKKQIEYDYLSEHFFKLQNDFDKSNDYFRKKIESDKKIINKYKQVFSKIHDKLNKIEKYLNDRYIGTSN